MMLPNRPTRWSDSVGEAALSLQTDNPDRSLFRVWSIDPNARGGAAAKPVGLFGRTLGRYNTGRTYDEHQLALFRPHRRSAK